MQQLITERLVTLTFSPLDELADWCCQIGLEVRRQEGGIVVLANPHVNFTTAIYDGLDPINKAVCLASAVAGPHHWVDIFSGLLPAVNKEWKARVQQERGKERWVKATSPLVETPPPTTGQPTFEKLYKRA